MSVTGAWRRQDQAEVVCEEPSPEVLKPHTTGKAAMKRVLGRVRVPDAILCYDTWALGALSTCAKAGVSVPRRGLSESTNAGT